MQQTALAAAISSTGATSITVDDALGFPATGEFTIQVDTEQLRVTAGNGTTTWTVTRGYGGTTAATHLDASTVYLIADGYADVSDVLATVEIPIGTGSDARRLLLADALGEARELTDRDCARSFFRYPRVSGTTTVYFDVAHCDRRSLLDAIGHPYTVDGRALDIVSVTSLYVRDSETSDYVSLGTQDTDWFLEAGSGPGVAGVDWPYEDITLSEHGSVRTTFPDGKRAVKAVLALGFPSVPLWVRRANVAEVREGYRRGPGGGPAQSGVNQWGTPIYVTGQTDEYRRLIAPGSPYVKRSFRSV